MADDVIITLNKFFSLVLIFTVTAINLWLVGNFLYWKNVFSKDKKCIITFIALSDLLIGLFCLPVEATLYFEIYLGGPGCVLSYVQVYSQFFSPFVYGVGITILCVELILKSKGMSFYNSSKLLILFISSLPWLFAVVVVVPLIFTGIPSHSCWYLPRNNRGICIWAITTFLPILFFLVMWIIMAFANWRSSSYSIWNSSTGNTSDHQQAGPANQSLITEGHGQSPTPADLETCMTVTGVDSSNSQLFHSFEAADNPRSHQLHENQQLVTTSSTSQGTFVLEEQASRVQVQQKEIDKGREALQLLVVILVYVSTSVPFALYNIMKLSSFLYANNSFTSEGTFFALKWMQSSRSLFIPLTWSVIFYIEKCKTTLY